MFMHAPCACDTTGDPPMRKARINRGIAGVMTLVMGLGQVPTSAIAEAINEPEGVTAEQ